MPLQIHMQTVSSFTDEKRLIMPCQTMRGHTDWVQGIVHLPDRGYIITCALDSSLRLWDQENGIQIGEDWRDGDDKVWSIALSPDGNIIASGSNVGKVRLWDVKTRKVIANWTGHDYVVWALCWSADGKRVASGTWNETVRVWDVNNSKNILTIKTGHNCVEAVMYSPDSLKLATGGDKDDAVKIWDATTGELLKTLKHDQTVYSLAWTSDGEKLISGSYGPIRIFNTATWQQINIFKGHTGAVTAISLSPNNLVLASASTDSTARLWSLETYLQVGQPLQHKDSLYSASLSPDGKVLVTGCSNKNAYAWSAHSILKKAVDGRPHIASLDSRSSLDDMSFLEADATRCPDQFSGVDEFSPAFFAGMEPDVDSSPVGGTHSTVNALLVRLCSLLQRFQPDNGEATKLQQPLERSSMFHLNALLVRLSSLIPRSLPENDSPDELQQPSTPSQLHPRVLLAHLSSLFPRSLLNTCEESQPHSEIPSIPVALISRLSSLLRSQPNEEIELTQCLRRLPVVEVAAVRDRQALVVAQGPQFKQAKRAYERKIQSHSHAQALSSHIQPPDASTSAAPPAPGTTAAQPPLISWWAQIVLLICCVPQPHASGH